MRFYSGLAILALCSFVRSPVAAQTTTQAAYRCDDFAAPTGLATTSIVTTRQGIVWFGDRGGNRLIRVTSDHQARPILPADSTTGRLTSVALGADGSIWYSKDTPHRVGRLPATGKGSEYELPPPNVFTSAIATAADGRTWYIDPVANKVGYVTVDGNVMTFDAPVVSGSPLSPAGIAIDGQNAAWVTSVAHNAIYRVDPASGAFTRYDIATANAQPSVIARGADGALWFIMPAVSKIGRITADGQMTEYSAKLVGLQAIAAGPDGATWYTSRQGAGRIDGPSGRVETFPCTGFGGMTIGPDGHLWILGDAHISIVHARTEARPARVIQSH